MTFQPNNQINKQELAKAVVKYIKQKPGFDRNDYYNDSVYRADYYRYKKDADFNRNFSPADILEILEPLNEQDIVKNVHQRVEIRETETGYTIGYTAGQYWCTEYQWGMRETLKSWINAHLVSHGLPLDQLMTLPVIEVHPKYGELVYCDRETEVSVWRSERDGDIYQTVQRFIPGIAEYYVRTYYVTEARLYRVGGAK
ncbi:hypothetical protein IAQ67_28580 (plasmid) [Paenibacillus peoriae]|uniref:Uncharacterized protein n=1 Tax=Paenibacillus peoriae TaxID=59893 RepID=A0A7H0YHB1_9BACL|nr:hypothetical protein [Paenibacillus peoriae]QNR70469.1 hypothetical protein IAQ67_28580 [Paenibacillus peoriae]